MSDGTKIEWTDATWNIVTGCDVVSPGCTNCYAMKLAGTRLRNHQSRKGLTRETKAGPVWTGEVRFNGQWLEQPLQWKRPRKIFVCAHGDLFHENVPNDWLDKIFAVMAAAPQHIFQVLTKRPERLREYAYEAMGCGEHWLAHCERSHAPMWPLPNVWLGVSVEDQARADERIPILLDTPAALRWLSMEPLLGPIDLTEIEHAPAHCIHALWGLKANTNGTATYGPGIDWVVVGGESGPGARPMHPDWVVAIHKQCESAKVPFLFKQWGEFEVDQIGPEDARSIQYPVGHVIFNKVGKQAAGRKLFGVEHNGFPA